MNHSHGHACHHEHEGTESQLRDPVCGMSVTGESAHRHAHGSQTYYFCSAHCLARFREDAERYLGDHATPPTPPRAQVCASGTS